MAEPTGEIYLADQAFVRSRQPRSPVSMDVPCRQRQPIRCSIEELLHSGDEDALAQANRQGYSLPELAAALGVHYATISRRLKREERALGLP
jgi:hypothetical protein